MIPEKIPSKFKHLALQLPNQLLKPLVLMPKGLSEQLMIAAINRLFKQALAQQELDFLVDNWLQLNVSDSQFYCFITAEYTQTNNQTTNQKNELKLIVSRELPASQTQADVEFSGDALSLLQLANKQVDPDTLFFQRKLLVTGQTELGLAIKNFLDDFELYQQLPVPVQRITTKFQSLINVANK